MNTQMTTGDIAARRWNARTFALIGLCALGFVALDWSRLVLRPADLSASPWSNALKYALVLLAASLAFRARGHGHSPEDERRFRVIFTIVPIADALFMVNQPAPGILLFGAVHVLLTRRNLVGWREARDVLRAHAPALLAGGVVAAVVAGGAVVWIHSLQGVTPLLVVIGLYVALLWSAVMAAWAARLIGSYPARHTLLMAVGMTCFMLCDLNVAANLVLPAGSVTRVVTESLTWMFYGPALCLLVLSAWRSEEAVMGSR
jgi:hypothetical protein